MVYCIFSAQYRPTVGGVENYTHYLAGEMARRGDKAVVVTSALPGLSARETLPDGVEVFRLPSAAAGGGRLPFVKNNAETKALMAEVAALKPDRVILQTRLYTLSLLGARFARARGLPAILIEHGHAYTTTGNPVVNAGLALYTLGLRKKLLRLCPNVYAVSQSASAWLAAHGTKAKGLLHNSISGRAIRAARDVSDGAKADGRDCRKEAGVPDSAYVVAYTGRLIPQKGIPELVLAVKGYNSTAEIPLFLLLAGEGELEGTLAADADPHIRCLGRLPFKEVVALLTRADIFCLPTEMAEGLPTSLLEAAACGAFSIATNMGGIPEILPPGGECGILLPDNRPKTIQAALEKSLADPAYRAGAAKKLQQRVLADFTYEALYEKINALPWASAVRPERTP